MWQGVAQNKSAYFVLMWFFTQSSKRATFLLESHKGYEGYVEIWDCLANLKRIVYKILISSFPVYLQVFLANNFSGVTAFFHMVKE